MGKTVGAVVGIVAAVAIAVAAPMLAPIALTAIGGAALAASATAVAIATAVIGLTLSIGLMLTMRALGVGAPTAKAATGPPTVFRQSIAESFIIYGKRRVGGLLVFYHPRQSGDDHFRYFVIACAGHRCQGVVTWMLGDEAVTVDGSNMVTSGKYANAAWLWFVRGTDTDVANATFVSECGGKWTTDHKGLGVAKIYAKFKMTDAVVQAGMPNMTAVIEGRDEVYNPSGAAGYSRNAARCFYDWMQIPREEGGFGIYADELPDTAFIADQVAVCDETVNSEARYSCDAVITTGAPPNEIRDVFIVNMAGSYTYSGGKHLMRPGYYVAPSLTLSEDDLAGAIQVSPFLSLDSAATEVQGSYISPDDGYQGMPFVTQAISPTPSDIRQVNLDLAFTTSPFQAQRVARIMLNRAQHEKTVVWPMNIAGLKAKALDTVQLDSPRYGLDNYVWTVAGWGLSADFGALLHLREENPDIYSAPTPVTPPTPPTIDQPEPIPSTSGITSLIRNSGTADLKFAYDSSGNVTISDHDRIYDDKMVAVDGTAGTAADGTGGTPIATGATSGQIVLVYYDQSSRAGGAVSYQYLVISAGGDDSAAYASSAHPYRHFVLYFTVPASGSGGGGGSVGSGGGGAGGGGGYINQQ